MNPALVSGLVDFRESPRFLRGRGKKERRKQGSGTVHPDTHTHTHTHTTYIRAQPTLKTRRMPTLSNTHTRRAHTTSKTHPRTYLRAVHTRRRNSSVPFSPLSSRRSPLAPPLHPAAGPVASPLTNLFAMPRRQTYRSQTCAGVIRCERAAQKRSHRNQP